MKKIKLLLAAIAAMVTMGASAQSWTGNTVAEGTFYLYNVGAGKFLNNGDPDEDWGTNAYLQAGFGLDITLEASGEAYNLNTRIFNNDTDHYLGTSGWCDAGATAFTFRAVDGETNVYQIINNGQYLMANEAMDDIEMVGDPGSRTTSTYWKLVSKDDFKAAMQAKTYSASDPMDVSIFIDGRSFARNDRRNNTWVTTHNGGNWVWIGGSDNKYYGNEAWNNTFDVHQDITGLPDGTYEVRCSGFGTNGTTFIYGNTKTGQLQTDNTTSYGTDKAAKWKAIHEDNAFAGQTTGTFTIGDGNLTVGIKRETNTNYDWCVYDEFRLYYYGLDLSEFAASLADAVAAAEATNGTIPTAAYNALADVVTAQNQTYTTAADYTAATNAINTAINTYASAAMVADYTRYKNVRTAVQAINSSIDVSAANTAVEAATTTGDIDSAVATLRTALVTYLAGANIENDNIDLTAALIDNASPYANANYWTVTDGSGAAASPNAFDANNKCAEFWSQKGHSIKQTLATELPVGYYTLTVVGYTREGYNAYIYAGENQQTLVGVASDVVNNRSQGNDWITQGNGVNDLTFQLTAATSGIEIGINTGTEGDYWTVWRSFKLAYLGTAPLAKFQDDLAAAVTAANAHATALGETIPAGCMTTYTTAISTASAQNSTAADCLQAIADIEAATAAADACVNPYTEYNSIKAKVEAMKRVEGYTEVNSSDATNSLTSAISTIDADVDAATDADGIATQTAALKAAGKTFLGGVRSDGAHPFDITYLITNPSFDYNNANGWTCNPAPGFQSYGNCEYYAGNTRTFNIHQTLTNMPKGNYELKVQAFQRPGWFRPTAPVTSVIYINEGQTTIKNLIDEGATDADHQWHEGNDSHDATGYYANSMRGAAAAFAAGNYWNTVLTAVEGNLEFGFKSTADAPDGGWTIFDNFQLFFYGNSINVAMSETEAFAALADIEGANVTMARTTKVGYNTVALPFDLTEAQTKDVFGDEAVVYAFSEDSSNPDDATINFTSTTTAISANVPVLVKATKAVSEITADNVTVKTGEANVEGTNFDFVGNYGGEVTIAAGDWFIGGGKLYQSTGATNIKGFRAYIKDKGNGQYVKMYIDGITTDIREINGATAEDGAIYTIAGQRVQKAQKGLYIINGKKVAVR